MLLVESLHHFVLLLDAVLDSVQVVGHPSVVFLLQVVCRRFYLSGGRQDVLDRIGDYEVPVRPQAHGGSFVYFGDGWPLVAAVVAKIPHRGEGLVAHCPRVLLAEVLGGGLAIVLEVAHGRGVTMFGVSLESKSKLAGEVGDLDGEGSTPGLEVVLWQKVEPVGGRLGGYLER